MIYGLAIRRRCAAALFGAGSMLAAAQATAYTFNDICAPETVHDTSYNAPRGMVIIDRSLSMVPPLSNRLDTAKLAIGEFADLMSNPGPCTSSASCDVMQLGLGWFSGENTTGDPYSHIDIQAAEDTTDGSPSPFLSTLYAYGGIGFTMTGEAAKQIALATSLTDASRTNIGIIVTDGQPIAYGIGINAMGQWYDVYPAGTRRTVQETFHYLCEARDRASAPVSTYMVGFSADADEDLNSLFAAAGGTGACCKGSGCCDTVDAEGDCVFPPGKIYDPCAQTRIDATAIDESNSTDGYGDDDPFNNRVDDTLTCQGAFQANSGAELKDNLLDIVDEQACVFPLDVPAGYPDGGALPDPAATRVTLTHANWAPDLDNPIVVPPHQRGQRRARGPPDPRARRRPRRGRPLRGRRLGVRRRRPHQGPPHPRAVRARQAARDPARDHAARLPLPRRGRRLRGGLRPHRRLRHRLRARRRGRPDPRRALPPRAGRLRGAKRRLRRGVPAAVHPPSPRSATASTTTATRASTTSSAPCPPPAWPTSGTATRRRSRRAR